MEKMKFAVQINAPRVKVWDVLWNDRTYRIWTSVFSEGSHVQTDWKEGGKILFLNGEGKGMHSIIEKNTPYEFMSFKHVGEFADGKELPSQWPESMENYRLTDVNGGTMLEAEIDIEEAYQDYFKDTFPKALNMVKELAEK